MGCDIHIYVETKEDGKWKHAQGLIDGDVPYADQVYVGRNYNLFGFLAGVRIPNQQHFKVKGFPKDASKEVRAIYKQGGSDYHTASFLTLKELTGDCWDGSITISGMIEKSRLTKINKELAKSSPNYDRIFSDYLYPYSAWSNVPNDVVFELNVPRRCEFKGFIEMVERRLPRYSCNQNPEDTRIVFWFDN